MKQWTNSRVLIYVLLLLIPISCGISKINDHRKLRQNYKNVNAVLHAENFQESFFKIHFKNGDVAIINGWNLSPSGDSLIGAGQLFDFNRSRLDSGELAFAIEAMSILETNNYEQIKSKDSEKMAALALLTGVNVVGAVACLANPKACFGSCPTFYINNESNLHETRAEGFSNAIAPVLENRDVDALKYATSEKVFRVYMKNEAYETHVVNQVELWAVPRMTNELVFVDEADQFYITTYPEKASTATVNGKDVSALLFNHDEDEYFSLTDSNDLTVKEDLLLEFSSPAQSSVGLALSFRQTLLTTFLLYEGLSWMGDEVGDYFAKMENSKSLRKTMDHPFRMLGDIECFVWDEKKQDWQFVQKMHETGPLAKNLQIIPLPPHLIKAGEDVKVKLTMAKGLWRLDFAGLAEIKEMAKPIKLPPSKLVSLTRPNTKTVDRLVADDEKYLVTFPGDEYLLEYEMPTLEKNKEHELFIAAKGYYLEWMRSDWLADKDPKKIKRLLMGNKATWHSLARAYKEVESEMEDIFWNSKYYEPQN